MSVKLSMYVHLYIILVLAFKLIEIDKETFYPCTFIEKYFYALNNRVLR